MESFGAHGVAGTFTVEPAPGGALLRAGGICVAQHVGGAVSGVGVGQRLWGVGVAASRI